MNNYNANKDIIIIYMYNNIENISKSKASNTDNNKTTNNGKINTT